MSDRRRYPRVQADVFYRPAGLSLVHHRRNTHDISLGGMRVYSDEEFQIGNRLELDILLVDGSAVRCWAEVVWMVKLKPAAPAGYDIGLKFMDMAPQDIERLGTVLRVG